MTEEQKAQNELNDLKDNPGYGFSEKQVEAIQKYTGEMLRNLHIWIADEKEKLNDLTPQVAEEAPDFLQPGKELSEENEEAINEELDQDDLRDKKPEELDADSLSNL